MLANPPGQSRRLDHRDAMAARPADDFRGEQAAAFGE
jgi:hypothetical protein